jgi:hypothetical protein
MKIRVLFYAALVPLVLGLTGCAAPLYKWGGYDDALYASYKDVTKTEALRIRLESHISEMEKGQQKVAPGLYAELGTLYLQSGSAEQAMRFYARERDTWPESRPLMSALIQNIERRHKPQEGAPQ